MLAERKSKNCIVHFNYVLWHFNQNKSHPNYDTFYAKIYCYISLSLSKSEKKFLFGLDDMSSSNLYQLRTEKHESKINKMYIYICHNTNLFFLTFRSTSLNKNARLFCYC